MQYQPYSSLFGRILYIWKHEPLWNEMFHVLEQWADEKLPLWYKNNRCVFQPESISGFQSPNSKPVINGDLLPLPELEATLPLARRRPGL